MTPSVRGRERIRVAAVLAASAAGTGALAGFAAGVAWLVAGLPALAVADVIGVVLVADLADGLHASTASRWLAPLSVRRQVPQLWGRIFGPSTAALLYGARLGVGPLTVLNTWLWWAAAVVGASGGPGAAALVGATFGAGRVAAMVVAAGGIEHRAPARMARLQAADLLAGRAAAVGAAVLALGLLLGACDGGGGDGAAGTSEREEAGAVTSTPAASEPSPLDEELAAALIDEPPAPDFAPRREGPLDLEAAVALEPDREAERALLETRRFVRGFRRSWVRGEGPTEEHAAAYVYRFADEAGARAYVVDGLLTIEGFGHEIFDLDGVAGAQGFAQVQETPEGARVTYGAVFARGADVYLLLRTGPGSVLGPGAVRELAVQQAGRLGA